MISEEYDVTPANKSCMNQINKNLIISTPGTATTQNLINAKAIYEQHLEYSKYDNTDSIVVKPLYGGNIKTFKKYQIIFKKNKYLIDSINEINAVKNLLLNKKNNYKKDYLVEVNELSDKKNNFNNLYIIKGNKQNKKNIVKKLYN